MKLEKLSVGQKKILRGIQESIPKEWTDTVTRRENIAPTTKIILEKALEDDEVDEDFKRKARLMLDSGMFNQQIDVENKLVAELIDAYVEKEIIKNVIAKKLPPLKKKISFDVAYTRYKQLKNQYEQHKTGSN